MRVRHWTSEQWAKEGDDDGDDDESDAEAEDWKVSWLLMKDIAGKTYGAKVNTKERTASGCGHMRSDIPSGMGGTAFCVESRREELDDEAMASGQCS